MTNNGDDCYFFYYSTCSKGDSCPFRHCEAAMGNETVCNLWKEGRCFRTVCMFRHMEITKNRKEISCYWENQAAGCQKPHCAFFHQKPRYIDGVFVPADKSQMKSEELPQEEPAPAPAAPLPAAAANPQLRGVIKTEAQEPVPSPTHPPVVINPADDDEDEDDQFSEEGEDGRVGPSPRKQKSGDSLNFGVSTLEEIRLRKALKASMKRAGYPIQSAASANGEKENIRSLFHPALVEPRHAEPLVFEETGRPRGSVAERLGRKMSNTESRRAEGVALKRSLAERLGRVVEEEDSSMPPQKALKPVKERLGLSAGSVSPSHPAETNTEPKKAPEQILIKTLEQIRQEKAAKSQKQKDGTSDDDAPEPNVTKPTAGRPPRGGRRAITLKNDSISEIKTFSEILRAKKKSQEKEEQQQIEKKTSPDADRPAPDVTDGVQVRVKTLEEIRRDKAARMQTQQTTEDKKSSDSEESSAKKPRLLRMKKPAPETGSNTAAESSPDVTEKLQKPRAAAAAPESNSANGVKVKTFEEIMQEKRLRKQQMEEQAKNSAEAEPSQKQTPEETLKRKTPVRVSFTSPPSTSQLPDTTTSPQRPPVRKLVPLRSKAASPPPESDSRSQSPSSSREVPQSPAKQTRGAPRAAAAAAEEKTPSSNKKTTPEVAANTRVRPKLNVKPSVKPAVHVKPGPKRKAAQRSAVAAVKPLNSASTVQEESLQETACKDKRVSPSSCADALLTSAVPSVPSSLLDSACSSSPLTEDLQTVPVFSQSRETKSSVGALGVPAPRETCCTVPQSPVLKAPAQPKSRRLSAAASRSASTSSSTTAAATSSSALDDFDELISEFTDDHMEGDMDPAIGEDDLLQELSDMIDS